MNICKFFINNINGGINFKMYRFFKYCFLLVLLISTSLFLGASTSQIQNERDDFFALIHHYPTYNDQYYDLYYKEYQINQNIIYTLNKVNHPDFLNIKDEKQRSFTFKDENSLSHLFVNQNYGLESDFSTPDLVEVVFPKIERKNQNMLIHMQTQNMYQQLYLEATLLNLNLIIFSAYRDYDYQKNIYNQSEDLTYVAKPGHSEHHTGEAIDIATTNSGLTIHFENTREFLFLKNNAHRFGFILRYPKGKENITGYSYEPWHFRYVGIDIATYIFEHDITLEEYIYQFIEIY